MRTILSVLFAICMMTSAFAQHGPRGGAPGVGWTEHGAVPGRHGPAVGGTEVHEWGPGYERHMRGPGWHGNPGWHQGGGFWRGGRWWDRDDGCWTWVPIVGWIRTC